MPLSQVVAETLKVLLVAVTAASQLSTSNGGDGGTVSLMRVLLPLLIQVSDCSAAGIPEIWPHVADPHCAHLMDGGNARGCHPACAAQVECPASRRLHLRSRNLAA